MSSMNDKQHILDLERDLDKIPDIHELLKKIVQEFFNPWATPQASSNTMRLYAEQAIHIVEEMESV